MKRLPRRTRIVRTMFLATTMILGFMLWLYGELSQPVELLSPKGLVEASEPTPTPIASPKITNVVIGEVKTVVAADDMSIYISEAVQEFLPTHKSESLMIMHCLAHRENGHAANNNCGDSGKACGAFQFHQETWTRMRKLMIKEGKATEISDRYNKKEAARTTAWAINNGNALEWGPILRDAKGSDYATCQKPSWYSKGVK